ncbi:MAG: helix-turn-helix domain-containing protein [Trichodesmium sp. MAG_R03]|nr:helix-turn-helix domain-containing protein [Trichodesmium sp. MAG_R03]
MKSIKAKLKVNNKQKTLMAQHAGYSRWCYNCQLSLGNAAVQYGYQKIGF